jgi:hypothetical protein
MLGKDHTAPQSLRESSYQHVRLRLQERHGVGLCREEYGRLLHRIQAGRSIVKLREKKTGCVLYAVQLGNSWFPVLYDPCVRLITTVYPKKIIDFHRRRLAAIDEFFNRLQKQSCPTPSSPSEVADAIREIKARNKELDRARKAANNLA